MGQIFQMINIDQALYAKKSFFGATLGWGKLGEWFFGDDSERLITILALPKVKIPDDPLEGQYFTSVNRTGIHTLPREIQQQIFDELEDFSDVFCFCMTSRYMWTVGIRTLRRLYTPWALREIGSWAGHRLIIPGDYSNDYPAGLLTDSELSILSNIKCHPDDTDFYRPLLNLADALPIDDDPKRNLEMRLAEQKAGKWRSRVPPPAWMGKFRAWTEVVDPYSDSFQHIHESVLRNLTTKEYVRRDALRLPAGYTVRWNTNPVSLGHAVMSRIVWSADPSVSIGLSDEFADKLVRGVWAGCRFDIVEGREWERDDGDGWKDVSAEVKEDLLYMGVQGGALSYDPDQDNTTDSEDD